MGESFALQRSAPWPRVRNVRFRIGDRKTLALYTSLRGARRFPSGVVDSFFEAMAHIAAASDRRDLQALRGLRLEKLSGTYKGKYSIRLNDQFRVLLRLETDRNGELVVVLQIVDYH